MNNILLFDIIKKIDNFVKLACINRPESHGYNHAVDVANNSFVIYENIHSFKIYHNNFGILYTVAMLHDVCDHKYDSNKYNEMKELLMELYPSIYDIILDMIDSISYSKENKRLIQNNLHPDSIEANNYWNKFNELTDIRNAVSDADKLLALGLPGLLRCIQYTLESTPFISYENLKLNVKNHCDEKLFKLIYFIRTQNVKKITKKYTDELKLYLDIFLQTDNIHTFYNKTIGSGKT